MTPMAVAAPSGVVPARSKAGVSRGAGLGYAGLGADRAGHRSRTGLPGPAWPLTEVLVVVHPGAQVVEAAQDLGVGAQEPDHQHGQQGHHDALEDDQDDHRLSLNSVAAGATGPRPAAASSASGSTVSSAVSR